MNAVEKRDLLDALAEIDALHQDGHVEHPDGVDIVPSVALTLTGFGHESVLHEGADAFCPGCRVIELTRKVREQVETLPVEAVKK